MARRSVSRKSGGVLSGHATVRDAGRAIRRHRFRSRFHAGGTAAPQTAGVQRGPHHDRVQGSVRPQGTHRRGDGRMRDSRTPLHRRSGRVRRQGRHHRSRRASGSGRGVGTIGALRHRCKGLCLRHHAAGSDPPCGRGHRSGPRTRFRSCSTMPQARPAMPTRSLRRSRRFRGNLAGDHVRQSRRHVQRRPGFRNR